MRIKNLSKKIHLLQIFRNILYIQFLIQICSHQNIIIFNSTHYRAGHSAFNSNGDMIIEYSYQNERLFYGLKKNGKHYFKENNIDIPTKTLIIDNNPNERYESRNMFISLNNTDENKEYLFSIGTYSTTTKTITELYDLDSNLITTDTLEFLGNRLYSYTFSLYNINNSSNYLIAYLTDSTSFIKLFSLSNFSLNNTFIRAIQKGQVSCISRVINSFQMKDNIILLFFLVHLLK